MSEYKVIQELLEHIKHQQRCLNIFMEAMAEVKVTDDGDSDQPIKNIVDGCIYELNQLPASPIKDSNETRALLKEVELELNLERVKQMEEEPTSGRAILCADESGEPMYKFTEVK